ncbi:MAG TPA: 2-oxo-4-hydroxy-4-carboxy-5-ureidoimidazoline decarboxylase [Candidatus Acidoferrum sp.]
MSTNDILLRWNQLPKAAAAEEILPCCGSRAWAREMTAARPFEDVATLLATSDRIWLALGTADWLEAFQSHPRIGETRGHRKSSARSQQWSAQEQSRATESPEAVKQALAQGNREYERKFGRIFIICASGKSALDILGGLQHRLGNDDATELREAAEQQRQIVQIRVKKWLTE